MPPERQPSLPYFREASFHALGEAFRCVPRQEQQYGLMQLNVNLSGTLGVHEKTLFL